MTEFPETRFDKNPDGSYTVVYGNLKRPAKDQIEAGRVLADLMVEYEQKNK